MSGKEKERKLRSYLSGFGSAVVAFSGGVDSATLAAVAAQEIDRVLAVTVVAENTPRREVRDAAKIANEIGVDHEFLELRILDLEEFRKNDSMRCYHCKKRILSAFSEYIGRYEVVLEGTNASDLEDYRPGYAAVRECSFVRSPFADCGITKGEIRELARSMGFSFYGKPSLACLATRVPFGERIDEEKLRKIDEAEEAVIEISGLEQVRVRIRGNFAIIEVDRPSKIAAVFDEVRKRIKKVGFKHVLLDVEGYRSGKASFTSSLDLLPSPPAVETVLHKSVTELQREEGYRNEEHDGEGVRNEHRCEDHVG